MNKFDQLVEDLTTGKVSINLLQMALRHSVRVRADIPESIKDLLCGKDEYNAGIIYKMFQPINEVIGAMELAFRRGTDFKE